MKKSYWNRTLKGTKLYIVLILLLSAIYSKLIVMIPMFIQYALDGVVFEKQEVIPSVIRTLFYSDEKIIQIGILALILVGINITVYLINRIKSKINVQFNLRVNRNVKQTVLEHIPKLTYLEFMNTNKSNVIQRVNNDATTYAEFFNSQINLFFDTIFIVVFAIAQTLQLNPMIGTFVAIILLLIVGISIFYFKVSKPLTEDIVEMNKQVIQRTTFSVEDAKMLKAFNRREKEIQDFKKINDEYRKKDIKLAKLKVWYSITTHTLRNFNEPFILLVGGVLVAKGQMTLAEISILLTYATKILQYAYKAVEKLKNANEFIVAYQKLANLMKKKEDIDTKPDIKLQGDIVFKDVSIKIEENVLLQHLNFTIKEGENVAIIGDNGSGKTIIAKTLIGFYEYTGEIYIGEHSIQQVSRKSIRDYIGIVLQDTYLFTGSIKENINVKDKEVTNEEIITACKLAEVYNDIKYFEGNIEYQIENGGNNISGGQKQRIAIARTLLLENRFVIFDDSLSKLDTKTKLRILRNVIEMKRGTIIISHDIEIVKQCDKVLFINQGTVKVGKHEELLRQYEEYRNIIDINQNKILEDEEI